MVKTLDPNDIVTDRRAYAAQRAELRRQVMPLRALRRVRLGDQIVLEFENADTLQYQVQEMVYAEGITELADVVHEVELYSRMLPSSHELAATMFIELDEVDTVRSDLERLTGVQHALAIEVGGMQAPGLELPGPDEEGPSERTYSVHFVRFGFTDEQRDLFRDPSVPAALTVDHPEYAESVPVDGELRLSLLADLSMNG